MPRSKDAERTLEETEELFAAGLLERTRDAAWRAAAAAAQVGDAEKLERLAVITGQLVQRGVEDAEQLRVYTDACLEGARKGTRPPSWFERLLSRDRRSR
jgi:hypothetical protein